MAIYMVDRDLPGVTMDQLGAAQKAAIETGQKFTEAGKNVRYIRTTFVPGEAHCMCLFEAHHRSDGSNTFGLTKSLRRDGRPNDVSQRSSFPQSQDYGSRNHATLRAARRNLSRR